MGRNSRARFSTRPVMTGQWGTGAEVIRDGLIALTVAAIAIRRQATAVTAAAAETPGKIGLLGGLGSVLAVVGGELLDHPLFTEWWPHLMAGSRP